jgi:hypothetical protein
MKLQATMHLLRGKMKRVELRGVSLFISLHVIEGDL